MSRLTCNVSRVTCHLSRVTCHMSCVTFFNFFYFFFYHPPPKKKYWSYDPHRSRDLVSPVCGIFSRGNFNLKPYCIALPPQCTDKRPDLEVTGARGGSLSSPITSSPQPSLLARHLTTWNSPSPRTSSSSFTLQLPFLSLCFQSSSPLGKPSAQ